MKRFLLLFLAISASGWLIFGCQNHSPPPIDQDSSLIESSESDEFSGRDSFDKSDEDSVIAIVNGTTVTRMEVDQEMDSLFQQFKDKVFPEKTDEFHANLWRQALENVINRKLLFQEAEREGILTEDGIVDRRIAEIEKRFHSQKRFKKQLDNLRISEEKLRQEIEHDLKIKGLLDCHIPKENEVSQEEIVEFYHANSESFHIPERIRVKHILIALSSEDTPQELKQKHQKIIRIKIEIDNGADFETLASHYSDCNSNSKGGDLGYFERGKMVKPFEDAAFGLKVDEVSEIVKTQYGYHLIKLIERQDEQILPLDLVRDKIISFLKREKRDLAIREYLFRLRSSAKIEYLENATQ